MTIIIHYSLLFVIIRRKINYFQHENTSSTQHSVTLFSETIRKNLDKGLLTGAVFVNLSEAFDTLDRVRLHSKLLTFGIKDRELSRSSSYLFDRKQFAIYNGPIS